jgi:hypothetical protein
MKCQFLQDVADVPPRRAPGYTQHLGDLSICQSARDKLSHLTLANRQGLSRGRRITRLQANQGAPAGVPPSGVSELFE